MTASTTRSLFVWVPVLGLGALLMAPAIAEPPLLEPESTDPSLTDSTLAAPASLDSDLPELNLPEFSLIEPSLIAPDLTTKALNPCPGIYYEEPHNQLHIVPSHCPPNLATLRQVDPVANTAETSRLPVLESNTFPSEGTASTFVFSSQRSLSFNEIGDEGITEGIGGATGSLPPSILAQEDSLTPPFLGSQQNAIARVRPQQGLVSVALTNNTATDITYEILGHIAPRTLAADESILLKDVPTPTTLTLVRPDGGFLSITPLDPTETQQVYTQEDSTKLLSLVLNASGRFDSVQGALTIEQDGQVFIQ